MLPLPSPFFLNKITVQDFPVCIISEHYHQFPKYTRASDWVKFKFRVWRFNYAKSVPVNTAALSYINGSMHFSEADVNLSSF